MRLKTKLYKKILSTALVATLLPLPIVASVHAANTLPDITLTQNPPIDVVLSVGATGSTVDPNVFKTDLTNALLAKGVPADRINISAVQSATASTASTTASDIVNGWQARPIGVSTTTSNTNTDYASHYAVDTTNNRIVSIASNTSGTVTGRPAAVYFNPNAFSTRNATIEFTWGIVASATEWTNFRNTLANKANLASTIDFSHGEAGFIFRMSSDRNKFYTFTLDNHSKCGNLQNYDPTASSSTTSPAEAILKFNQGSNNPNTRSANTAQQNGTNQLSTATTVSDDNNNTGTSEPAMVKRNDFQAYNYGRKEFVKIVNNGNNTKIYMRKNAISTNNPLPTDPYQLVFDWTDPTSLTSGTYGFYVWDQPGAYFSDIKLTTEATRTFSEIVRTPTWTSGSKRFIVNLDDNLVSDFSNAQKTSEILTRLSNDDAHYIGWGTNTNKAEAQAFIAKNNNKGMFTLNTNYAQSISDMATYIFAQYVSSVTNPTTYFDIDVPQTLTVSPSSLQTNTIDSNWPKGKWRIKHDATYFENSLGLALYDNQYLNNLDVTFTKPGKYDIYYQDQLVKTVYAHRKPVAQFTASLDANRNVTVNSLAYDPDHQTAVGKGIVSTTYQWKDATATTWTAGLPASALAASKDYIIQQMVTDVEGATSLPYNYYITTSATVPLAVPLFSVANSTIYKSPGTLSLTDLSYAPTGTISAREWTVENSLGGVVYGPSATAKTDFSTMAAGAYKIKLRVQNATGWSDYYSQMITLLADTTPPTVGGGGDLTTSNRTTSSVDLAWTIASDDSTPQSDLKYKVVRSTTNNVNTLGTIETNGTLVKDWTSNLSSWTATGLNPDTLYYFNVIVKDSQDNKSIYTMASAKTFASVIDVEDGERTSKLKVDEAYYRRSGSTGAKLDEIEITQPQTSLITSNLTQIGSNTARIDVPDSTDEVTRTRIDIPSDSVAGFKSNGKKLEVKTRNARVDVPATSFISGQNAYFEMVPIKDTNSEASFKSRAASQMGRGNNTITIASRPVDIATNVQNKQVNVLIPLDASVRAADYHNLVVYVEHSDGTKEVLPNSALTVVDYDTTGTKAVQFTTTKFSTFGAMLAPDATAPTAGNSGAVQASNSTSSTVDVAWSAATDDVTAQASLQYKLVYSTSNNISTVDLANTNGTVASDWADNYTSATVSGLSGNTTYYFNVLVRDGAGNMTVYSGANATTLQAADTTPPIVGNSGTIDATNPTVSSIDLAWGRATDGRTAQANLEYRVVYSTTPGLTTVSAALSGGTIAKDWTANLTSLTVTGLNDSTTYYFNVLVRDASGNVSIYTMANQTTLVPPDTTAPNTPVITAPTPNQLMTHASPDLTGTAEPGATMTITVGGRTYTTTADANGDWSVHVSPDLPDGTYTASVTATDAAGNTSGAATVTFTIDTSLPTAPVFTAPTDHQLLSNPTPTIEGTAGAGLTIEVTVGGHTYVTTADAQGNWSITVNTPLPDGTYDAVAIAKDSHGIASPQATVTFEVDATPPQAPTILDPTANQVLTTGTPSIEGTAEPGSTVTITVGGNTFTTVANGQGSWSVVVSPALADGTYTATVTATDAAGNVSNPETVTFDIDTTPPADPVITSPTAGAVLSNNTPAITGTAIPGSTIIVTINGQTYTTTADPQGNWSVTVSPALPDGSYTASVTATDPAGNVSNASTVSFDIDTTPPADPVITSPTAGAVLSNNTPTIEGLAEPGSTVTVTINGQTYTTTADPQGNWSVTVSPALADGSYTASVTATDPAGNMSQASTVSFEIDSTPPTDPIITAPTANATLSNATPTIEGLAEPGSTVTVTINGQTYTTTADPQGNWSVTVSPALADGSYTASVIATDPAGNMSQASTVSFEIDTTPPADPIITAPTANATLSNATPTISGTAEPGSIVTVTINGQTYLTTADAQGNWSVSVSPALPDGSYTASVTATDASGNTSAASTISFKIDTTAPNAPSTPDLTTVSDSGASNTDNITADRTPTFTGTSEPNAIIELYADGVLVGTTIADGNGDWSVTADPMADGVYDFTVVAIDAVNNQSSPSQALSVTIDASAPGAPTLAASTTNPTADPVIITITYVSNATLNEYKLGAGGTWTTYTGPITITENIRIYARSTDDAGNTSSVPSLNVTNILNGPSSTPVYVNGTQFNVGSETLVGSVTVVQVDTNQMLASINQAVSNNPNATNNLVYVPVQSHSQNQVEVKLDAQTVTQLVNHDFDIKILTTLGSYTLPSEELSSSPIMKSNQAQLFVSITKSDAQQVATTNAIAKQQKINVVGNPVNFEVAIKTPHSTVRVNTFSRYVSRTIALPNNVDPNKITTGIVVNPNGTFAHIPTVVSYVGGKYFAQLNSVTNSTYAVVYSPKSFADVKGYWGEVAINDLYSRHILEGLGTKFNPGSTLTRGDFIVWLTKAMGIYRKGAGVASYSDVASSSTYYDAVSIAKRYHLINGRSSSKFSPNKEITRQEAIVILSKALNLTGSKVKKATAISSFLDNETITSWAIPATAKVLNNGTIVGYPSKTLRLTANMTRAEAATTIERLLLNAQLINRN